MAERGRSKVWLLSACPPARAVDLSWRLCFYCFQLRHKRTHSGKLYLSFIPVFFFLFFVSLLLPIALSFDKETIAFGSERRFSRLQQRESPPSSIPIEAASDRSDLCLCVRADWVPVAALFPKRCKETIKYESLNAPCRYRGETKTHHQHTPLFDGPRWLNNKDG